MKNFDTELRMVAYLAERSTQNEFHGIPGDIANMLTNNEVLGKITENMYPGQSYEITIRIQAIEE